MRRLHASRARLLTAGLVLLAIASAAAVGIWLQLGEREALETRYRAGETAAPDRVDIAASVQRVDAAARELVLRVVVTPRGSLAEAGGISPAQRLTLQTSPAVRGDLTFPAHSRIAAVDVPVTLSAGSITDYPFDAYDTALEFGAVQGGEPVPVRMTLTNRDALFAATVDAYEAGGAAVFDVGLSRSTSVLVFGVFMMLAMWALAIAVLIGAWFLISRRKGLTWPALGWMAATLFALAAFRNTAPGAPPIGSLVDYIAFFWAESLIAFCLITVVVMGMRQEANLAEPDQRAP
ncbi:DUF4436 domain-containing protein [Streptomyces xanthii]|uniref:DUF4436 domain-containing protein n=1 Tax=Streptomyces xanthii TaxID=2768069 RepID=A0A7H1BK80_9ACTN|nr:DUF4436 domain-containing protein [Streptomyces xanthii]QNS09135.1 DUF4436 domain-containing protein [Streptomyces xanthii]